MKKNILITTYPFGSLSKEPLRLLEQEGFNIDNTVGELKRKLRRNELKKKIREIDGIIAGTELYDREIISAAKKLKIISRAGIGLDSIDFKVLKEKKIEICYTPDAPSQAVAELTIGLIISIIRDIPAVYKDICKGRWTRTVGMELENRTVGIIGLGRIGKKVAKLLVPFNVKILVNDLEYDEKFINKFGLIQVPKERIYRESDVITLHVPLTDKTYHLINSKSLKLFKKGCYLINTSRGKVIKEEDIITALQSGTLKGAALDVFEKEPYRGPISKLNNVILTPHLASCSDNSRIRMEIGAVRSIIQFFRGETPEGRVPEKERINYIF